MSRCMVGEATALVIAQTIRDNQKPHVRSPFDIAILANRNLAARRMRAKLTPGMVNSFISYHPLGQEIAEKRQIGATKGKKLPDWADSQTELVDNIEQKPGELVVVGESSGLAEVDHHIGTANGIMNRLARKLPASAQEDVSQVVDSMSMLAMTVRLQQQIIDARTDANNIAHRLLAAA